MNQSLNVLIKKIKKINQNNLINYYQNFVIHYIYNYYQDKTFFNIYNIITSKKNSSNFEKEVNNINKKLLELINKGISKVKLVEKNNLNKEVNLKIDLLKNIEQIINFIIYLFNKYNKNSYLIIEYLLIYHNIPPILLNDYTIFDYENIEYLIRKSSIKVLYLI